MSMFIGMLNLPKRSYRTLWKSVTKCFKKEKIDENKLKYFFTYDCKKISTLGKLYLLTKIHKRLYDVPRRPVISNCGTPTEKISEFLHTQLKTIMQKDWSYVKDSSGSIRKIRNLTDIPESAILITPDVVGLYPSIPHQGGLEALKKTLDETENIFISTDDIVKIAEFVLKNNYFQFNGWLKSGIAIGTQFTLTSPCVFMDQSSRDWFS